MPNYDEYLKYLKFQACKTETAFEEKKAPYLSRINSLKAELSNLAGERGKLLEESRKVPSITNRS
jgi:hypothetical protein